MSTQIEIKGHENDDIILVDSSRDLVSVGVNRGEGVEEIHLTIPAAMDLIKAIKKTITRIIDEQ